MNSRLKNLPLAVALLFLLGLATQLWGETLALDLFTAEAPPGWAAGPAEDVYYVFDPEEKISMLIGSTVYAHPEPSVMARRLGAEYAVKTLDDSAGFLFFEDKDYRFWRGLSPEGRSLEVSVHGTHPKLAGLLKSIEISSETKKDTELAAQLQVLLENLKRPEVIDWLTFAAPLFAEPPAPRPEPAEVGEPAATTPWRGELQLTAKLPQGWNAATENGQTRFTSPDQKEYLLVIPIASAKVSDFGEDYEAYKARCVAEVHQVGGVNIRAAEGTVYFDLPDLSRGEVFHVDEHIFILVRQGGSPELEALHWSLFE